MTIFFIHATTHQMEMRVEGTSITGSFTEHICRYTPDVTKTLNWTERP